MEELILITNQGGGRGGVDTGGAHRRAYLEATSHTKEMQELQAAWSRVHLGTGDPGPVLFL